VTGDPPVSKDGTDKPNQGHKERVASVTGLTGGFEEEEEDSEHQWTDIFATPENAKADPDEDDDPGVRI
jgi:hypothetical protein